MQNVQGLDSRITVFAHWLIRWRWAVLLATLAVFMGVISGARFLGFNDDYRIYFSEDNPHLQAFDALQRTYTKNDNILFAISPESGKVFRPETLMAVEELTREAWYLPYVLRVDSISNFQYSRAEEDDLIVTDLIEGSETYTEKQLNEAQAIALNEPFILGQLLNENSSVTAVNVTFHMPGDDATETGEVVAAARLLKQQLEEKHPIKIHMSGVVMLSNAFAESAVQDIKTLMPLMYGFIILVMLLLLRSFSGTLSTIVVIFLSVGAAMGSAGFIGIELTSPSMAAMTIIMTLAVADSIHVLVTMLAGMRTGLSRNEAIAHSLRLNLGPVFLTSLTTAVGFLSMNFSDAPPFRDLGNITAMGVVAAFILSVTVLPALMAILPVKVSPSQNRLGKIMENLGDFVIAKRKGVFIVSILVVVGLLAAIPLNKVDDNFVGYFDESVQFRVDTDYVDDNLTGVYQIQYSLSAGEDFGVSNPEFLQTVDDFVEWFRTQPEVRHVNSFVDTFKRINKNMHADDASYYRLPEDKELSAQYLLLYELSLPEGLDLNNQMDIGKSSTQITVTLSNTTSSVIADVAERGRQWLSDNHELETYGVGPAVMFSFISDNNTQNMFVSTLFAIFIISVLITISLRNLRIGALSIIPNLLPLATAFGAWGLLYGEVNVAVSTVSGMALGIVVDDSVHFLSKYLRARREQGLSSADAVRYAFSTVGIALLVTSIILVAGFIILGQSSFGMNSNMAALTAIAIVMALLADFLLLPVILLKLDQKQDYSQGVVTTKTLDDSSNTVEENQDYA